MTPHPPALIGLREDSFTLPPILIPEKDRPVVFCSKWTNQKTVHIGRDTVATLRSTIDQIRRCTVIFKVRFILRI